MNRRHVHEHEHSHECRLIVKRLDRIERLIQKLLPGNLQPQIDRINKLTAVEIAKTEKLKDTVEATTPDTDPGEQS